MRLSSSLAAHPLFRELLLPKGTSLSIRQHAERSYLRAESIGRLYGLSADDILTLSPMFWEMHIDPILCADGAATTLLTIQYNLVIGTLAMLSPTRQDIKTLIEDLLNFKILGQFCLTEVGHGLDASSLETTATLLSDGGFDLHTPSEQAAKFMPPTIPVLGRPCVGVVYAQLVTDGTRKGIRPFLVPLNDGHRMSKGISARLLPSRHGSAPVNHSITYFNHVKVPSTALLWEAEDFTSERIQFLWAIWRVGVGALALSSIVLPAIQMSTCIAGRYSFRRIVRDSSGCLKPIIMFPTQYTPILTAVAQSFVLREFHKCAIKMFVDSSLDHQVRHGVAACFKAVMLRACRISLPSLSSRCGAQGLFDYNGIISYLDEIRGIAIAEGDVLVLSIRLVSELLLDRYSLPVPNDTRHPLSKYETGMLNALRSITEHHGHRSSEFASLVLPRCLNMAEAIGHRMAYEAAVSAAIPAQLVEIFVCDVVKDNLAWYTENGVLTSAGFTHTTARTYAAAFPRIVEWIDKLQVDSYVKAPIVSNENWARFVSGLDYFAHSSRKGSRSSRAML